MSRQRHFGERHAWWDTNIREAEGRASNETPEQKAEREKEAKKKLVGKLSKPRGGKLTRNITASGGKLTPRK